MIASVLAELTMGFDQPFAALGARALDDDRVAVIAWPSVPVEIVRAAGFRPVFARGNASPTPRADLVLEPDIFPGRLRQLVEAALSGRLAQVAAIVLPRTSDADYKCFLYLRELIRRGEIAALPPVLLFDLMHSPGAVSREYSAARARALLDELADIAGNYADAAALSREIARANRARAAARRLESLRGGSPRLAGVEAMPLLGAIWQLDPERYAALADAAAAALSARPPLACPRVLLAGTPVDATALHAAVQDSGATVVAEQSPFGSGAAADDVSVLGDPFLAIAECYGADTFDARLPVGALMRRFDSALDSVDAVIVSLPPEDASFGWDIPRMRALCEQRSIPHAVVNGEP